jgi:putative ABC transport system ATP-binding protein
MLKCERISKVFNPGTAREIRAVDEVTFEVQKGEFVMMLGENGAGKTTLLNLIAGQLYPDSGKILLNGKDISALSPHKRASSMTRIYQSRDSGLPQAMTVREVMRLALASRRIIKSHWCKKLTYEMVERLERIKEGLSNFLDEQMWNLSGGEHQLVSLAIAIILSEQDIEHSHLLLLDEHISQLDPIAHDMVMDTTDRIIKKHGLSAIMATQDHEVAAKYGSRQVILSRGRVIYDFTSKNRLISARDLTDLLKAVKEKPGETKPDLRNFCQMQL